MNVKTKLLDRLLSVEVPKASEDAAMGRLSDVLAMHISRISVHVPLAEQLKRLAFDCYTQGLIDGAQIGEKMRSNVERNRPGGGFSPEGPVDGSVRPQGGEDA